MMPPNCCLCDKGLETGDECELICFHKTPEQEAWYSEAETRLIPDHPPNCEWFCKDHVHTALAFIDMDCKRAIEVIRSKEAWTLMEVDLFDRDTPPYPVKYGVGFECGLFDFWVEILSTVQANGNRVPQSYQLRIGDEAPGYTVERWTDEFLRLKQHMETCKAPSAIIQQIASAQAVHFRSGNRSEADRWLAEFYRELPDANRPADGSVNS